MTPEEEQALVSRVAKLADRVGELEAEIDRYRVNGLGDAFSGTGNQTYGGGRSRLDQYGRQVVVGSAVGSKYFFDYAVSAFIASDPSLQLPLLATGAYTSATALQQDTNAYLTAGNYGRTFVFADNTPAQRAGAEAARGSTLAQGYANIGSTDDGHFFVRPALYFASLTADPAGVADGMDWYRSDLLKRRTRINGATENLATESYVATNGASVKTEQMIMPISWCSLGVQLAALSNGTATSQTWPTANKALYFPFTLDESTTFTKAFWMNGATVSGNVDIGIYNEAGTKQVSMGSTAQATINSIQEVNIADTTLAAGRYYMALSCDNTTATFYTWLLASALYSKVLGCAEQTSAFALPSPATLATPTTSSIPVFGFSIRTLVT